MDKLNGNRAFTDSGGHAFDGAVADVTDSENSGNIGFKQAGIAVG